jgi:hypothetical protein
MRRIEHGSQLQSFPQIPELDPAAPNLVSPPAPPPPAPSTDPTAATVATEPEGLELAIKIKNLKTKDSTELF